MFEQERLCGDATYTIRAEQLRDRDQQVDGEGEEVAHGVNRTIGARSIADQEATIKKPDLLAFVTRLNQHLIAHLNPPCVSAASGRGNSRSIQSSSSFFSQRSKSLRYTAPVTLVRTRRLLDRAGTRRHPLKDWAS
jgi:hypothetical protein